MRYALRSCVWELTIACCFSCKYCGSGGGHFRPNELTTEECRHVVDQLADLGCSTVHLIGGEVFMRPDWDAIVQRLNERGLRVSIITNGFLFSDELLRRMKAVTIDAIAISLDAPEAIHDRYRQEGSFRRAVSAMQTLIDQGYRVSVISTLNAENVAHLEELYQFLTQYSIWAWQLQACSPMGNAAVMGVDYHFSAQTVIDFVEQHRQAAPFLLGIADNIGYFTETEGYLRGDPSGHGFFRGCSAGLSTLGIDSVGNVRGCESMYDDAFIEGNLREESLRTIWEDPERFAYNRKFTPERLTGACATCDKGLYCAGGCRSYNHFVHGKLYESPLCARVQTEQR